METDADDGDRGSADRIYRGSADGGLGRERGVAAPEPAVPGKLPAIAAETPFGAYLAGRHAQEEGNYRAAALWYEEALKPIRARPN